MFEDEYKKANERLRPSSEAEYRVLSAMRGEDRQGASSRRGFSKGMLAAAAAVLCVLFITPALIGIFRLADSHLSDDGRKLAQANVIPLKLPDTCDDRYGGNASQAYTSEDYSAVFAAMQGQLTKVDPLKFNSSGNLIDAIGYLYGNFGYKAGLYEEYAVSDDGIMPNDSAMEASGRADDHSNTNTQVEGVDEADVIKTDGRYIYALDHSGVTILSANGADTVMVSKIASEEMPKHHENASAYFLQMYVNDSKLFVIAAENVFNDLMYEINDDIIDENDVYYCGGWWRGASVTSVYVFNIEDAGEPKLENTLCCDGSYMDSRLTDNRLYLITSYCPYGLVVCDMPATYVPCTYDGNGGCELTSPDSIHIMSDEENDTKSYTYVTALDVDDCEDFSGTLAILGNAFNVYCSRDNLYVSECIYESSEKEVRFSFDEETDKLTITDSGDKTGRLYSSSEKTVIYRIKLGSQPVLAATGSVEGSLLNQFCMDEYEGFLRVVTDRESWTYVEETLNEDGTWSVGYPYDQEEADDNALYVLDMDLNTVGAIEDIGRGEHVKSVRFMDEIGYIVTFRQTDPLFSIDLSDAAHPKVVGELHIPGFSEYMHGWSEGRLFGLGQDADEHSGGVLGLKLSMFDVTDPSNVSELFCKKLENSDYSSAEYNHKAILVSPEKGIVGFPVDWNRYVIYSYDDVNGFVRKAEIKLSDNSDDEWYYGDLRGLYIGEYFYIVDCEGGRTFVINLNSFEVVANIKY